MSDVDALIVRCMRGKPMDGWVLVEAEAVAEDPQLKEWIDRSRADVKTLPAK